MNNNDMHLRALICSMFVFNCLAMMADANRTAVSAEPETCGDTQRMADECFKELPPHLIDFLQSPKIVINEQQINAKCTVFHRGMQCFDEYSARCLNDHKRHLYENNVEGARNFFQKFCGDREFQKAYLQHKECFGYIHSDWQVCTKNFQQILSDELLNADLNVTDKYIQFCCTRYAYENCLYRSARFKCYRNSVEFARYTAQLLSDEKHFTNCRKYEDIVCANAAWGWPTIWQSFAATTSLMLVHWICGK